MKYSYIISIITLMAVCISTTNANASQASQASAADLMRKVSATLKQSPSIDATFTVAQGANSSSGKITLSGNRFQLSTPQMSTWFDGKTQWAYSPSAGEVNISEPTTEELQQINPFAIIDGLNENFTLRRIKSTSGYFSIEFTPKQKGEYSSIVATFDASTFLPHEIILTSTDRTITKIKIQSIKPGKTLPASTFRFNAKSFPGVEVVDLR